MTQHSLGIHQDIWWVEWKIWFLTYMDAVVTWLKLRMQRCLGRRRVERWITTSYIDDMWYDYPRGCLVKVNSCSGDDGNGGVTDRNENKTNLGRLFVNSKWIHIQAPSLMNDEEKLSTINIHRESVANERKPTVTEMTQNWNKAAHDSFKRTFVSKIPHVASTTMFIFQLFLETFNFFCTYAWSMRCCGVHWYSSVHRRDALLLILTQRNRRTD